MMPTLGPNGFIPDPELAAQIESVWKLATEDARSGADLRGLPAELAHLADEYEARYVEVLVELAAAKESN